MWCAINFGGLIADRRSFQAAQMLVEGARAESDYDELVPELVAASQELLSTAYLDGKTGRWGEMSGARWDTYLDWLSEEGLLTCTAGRLQSWAAPGNGVSATLEEVRPAGSAGQEIPRVSLQLISLAVPSLVVSMYAPGAGNGCCERRRTCPPRRSSPTSTSRISSLASAAGPRDGRRNLPVGSDDSRWSRVCAMCAVNTRTPANASQRQIFTHTSRYNTGGSHSHIAAGHRSGSGHPLHGQGQAVAVLRYVFEPRDSTAVVVAVQLFLRDARKQNHPQNPPTVSLPFDLPEQRRSRIT